MSKTHPESKCPELLANYCDLLLRKTPLSKKLTSEEIDDKLRNVVCFCYSVIRFERLQFFVCLLISLFVCLFVCSCWFSSMYRIKMCS